MKFNYDFQLLPQYLEKLLTRLRIAVIHGGDKNQQGAVIYQTHNPRSTKTYQTVAYDIASALNNLGFQEVFVMADDMNLGEKLQKERIHLAWLNTGGVQGYNPVCHTPAILELLGVPYVGHNPLNSSILDNKHAFKRELQGLGFPTAPFMICHPAQGELNTDPNSHFAHIFQNYQGAFIVKPVSGRASLNIYVVDEIKDLAATVAEVQRITDNTALIETYLPGREFCVAVCGYVTYQQGQFIKNKNPFTFSTIERILASNERIFTSMDTKAITTERLRLIGDDEANLKQELIDLAQKIYWNFNLNTLIRLDLRSDENNKLYVLEANPKPDLKKPTENVTSLVVQGLSEYDMNYEDLILSLLADRLDYLFTYHQNIIGHIIDLLV